MPNHLYGDPHMPEPPPKPAAPAPLPTPKPAAPAPLPTPLPTPKPAVPPLPTPAAAPLRDRTLTVMRVANGFVATTRPRGDQWPVLDESMAFESAESLAAAILQWGRDQEAQAPARAASPRSH